MRKILLILVCILAGFAQNSSFGQSGEIPLVKADLRISQAFGQEFVTGLEKSDPLLILYYNFYLDNAYYIQEMPVDKSDFVNSLISVDADPLDFKENINILQLGLELNFEKRTYYRMKTTNFVMIFYSGLELTDKFNVLKTESGFSNTNQIK